MVDDLLRLILAHVNREEKFPIIVAGDVGAGKTSTCMDALDQLEEMDLRVGGVLSPRVIDSGVTVGYDVVDLFSGERENFLRTGSAGGSKVGRFYLQSGGLAFTNRAISRGIARTDLVFFDEVGRMELSGEGLVDSLEELLEADVQGVYLVRKAFVERFRRKFQLDQYDEIRVSESQS